MKRNFFLLLTAMVGLCGCNWESQSQFTPTITPSYLFCYHADSITIGVDSLGRDTLLVTYKDDIYRIDTIHTLDTVRFSLRLCSYENNLTGFSIEYDSTALAFGIDSIQSIQHALDSTSVPAQCQLKFVPGYVVAVFPVHYIARKSGVHDFKLTVSSDSKYSPVSFTLRQPVAN